MHNDKYSQTKISGTPIDFKDFNFKLAVINELMYKQDALTPKFDVHEFAEWYQGRKIDVDEEGHELIPEVVDYFKNLEIDSALAERITSLEQDGGDEIYLQVLVFWDGEDDTFNIQSTEDTASFPNLTEMTLFYDDSGDGILDELRTKGIEADWL